MGSARSLLVCVIIASAPSAPLAVLRWTLLVLPGQSGLQARCLAGWQLRLIPAGNNFGGCRHPPYGLTAASVCCRAAFIYASRVHGLCSRFALARWIPATCYLLSSERPTALLGADWGIPCFGCLVARRAAFYQSLPVEHGIARPNALNRSVPVRPLR